MHVPGFNLFMVSKFADALKTDDQGVQRCSRLGDFKRVDLSGPLQDTDWSIYDYQVRFRNRASTATTD